MYSYNFHPPQYKILTASIYSANFYDTSESMPLQQYSNLHSKFKFTKKIKDEYLINNDCNLPRVLSAIVWPFADESMLKHHLVVPHLPRSNCQKVPPPQRVGVAGNRHDESKDKPLSMLTDAVTVTVGTTQAQHRDRRRASFWVLLEVGWQADSRLQAMESENGKTYMNVGTYVCMYM